MNRIDKEIFDEIKNNKSLFMVLSFDKVKTNIDSGKRLVKNLPKEYSKDIQDTSNDKEVGRLRLQDIGKHKRNIKQGIAIKGKLDWNSIISTYVQNLTYLKARGTQVINTRQD